MKAKSDERKESHGIEKEKQDVKKMDHKKLPSNVRRAIDDAKDQASKLGETFKDIEDRTSKAIEQLQESQKRVMTLRKDASLSHNENFFEALTDRLVNSGSINVFGNRGRGLYQDSVLSEIETKINERTDRLEQIIQDR